MSTTPSPPSTCRLVFRRLKASDTDFLHSHLNTDRNVMQFINDPLQYEDTIRDVQSIMEGYASYPAYGRWIGELRETGEPVGWFALSVGGGLTTEIEEQELPTIPSNHPESKDSNHDGGGITLEIGYRLRRRFWGTGLATEGSRALVDYAFSDPLDTHSGGIREKPRVRRIVGNCMHVNERSRRVMEKCGLRHTRTVMVDFPDPLPGTEKGEALFEMGRWEWERFSQELTDKTVL